MKVSSQWSPAVYYTLQAASSMIQTQCQNVSKAVVAQFHSSHYSPFFKINNIALFYSPSANDLMFKSLN